MKKTIVLFFVSFTICAMPAAGQSIYDVRFRLPERSDFEATKISVEDTRYIGINYISHSDSIIMKNCGTILRRDIDFSPYFEIVLLDTFFLRHLEISEMSILGWQRLGSEYLVRLEAEFPGDNIRIRYRLISIQNTTEIKKGKFETNKNDYRALAHQIANDIVKFLTGDEGIYRTKIVYVRQTGDSKELYLADYDGHNERPLTNNSSINISPAYAPDGEKIYFTSYMDGDPKIYTINLKSNNIELFADYPGINAAPAVSPDGKSIACVLSKDGNSEIYLLDRAGKMKKRLTKSWSIESAPTWSPDGKEIAFTSDRTGSPQIYIMDKEGLNTRRLTYIGTYNDSPCWSPKGDKITFVSREQGFAICTIDVTGKNFKVLTNLGDGENPHFSPDGNHIIFSSNRLGSKEIYTMDMFGQDQRRTTIRGGFSNPIWSPMNK